MTLGDLAKYSVTRSVARSLCDRWASCLATIVRRIKLLNRLRQLLYEYSICSDALAAVHFRILFGSLLTSCLLLAVMHTATSFLFNHFISEAPHSYSDICGLRRFRRVFFLRSLAVFLFRNGSSPAILLERPSDVSFVQYNTVDRCGAKRRRARSSVWGRFDSFGQSGMSNLPGRGVLIDGLGLDRSLDRSPLHHVARIQTSPTALRVCCATSNSATIVALLHSLWHQRCANCLFS